MRTKWFLLGALSLVCIFIRVAPEGSCLASGTVIVESRFAAQAPTGWQMEGPWAFSAPGALADGECAARRDAEVPEACLVEMVFDLPASAQLEQGATVSISVGPEGDEKSGVKVSARYGKTDYNAAISGAGQDGSPVSASASGDTRPSVLRAWEQAADDTGWAEKSVSLGLALSLGRCRLFVNGSQTAEVAAKSPAGGKVSLAAKGILLRSVRILPPIPNNYTFLGGIGMAMLSGGASAAPAVGTAFGPMQTARIEVGGVPMLVQGGEAGLAAMDVSAEKWKPGTWSEGTGLLTVPVAPRPYSRAYVLIHRASEDADKTPAMGFGLRVQEMSAADLKNIYVGEASVRSSDEGVSVQPVPELGEAWFLARVPLNPAAMHWFTHDAEGNLLPIGTPPKFLAYVTRPWHGSSPGGKPSSLQVAAITLEEAGIDLVVKGNGLGNVYCEPEQPTLSAALCNLSSEPVTVGVTTELIPFERSRAFKREKVRLGPGEKRTLDALAAPIRERGHYKVRVIADGGPAGRVDYRTNVALLAPDTRKKVNSPFGCWSALWGDTATEAQRDYLKEKAGVGFLMGKHNFDIRMGTPFPDDAAAEEIVKKVGPEARIFMFGWEHTWTMEQTFAFPRVISEGKPEVLPDEAKQGADKTADEWRRVARAIRRLRPDLKISLGNSAVNFSVPFLERGFKPGVEFDYFGTEEGLFSETPERPADAIGNINWWTKAVCEHFGFKNVPIFHSESIYYPTGLAFSGMAQRTQAGNYVREYLLGFPYNSIYGCSAAMVDSGNQYIYSIWGTAGYCNQAPGCSPKLSFVAYATLTQLLDGAKYEGKLNTGTTSVYALRFRQPDGALLYAIWGLRGSRHVAATLVAEGRPEVVDALNRPVEVRSRGKKLSLTISDLPLYVRGVEIEAIEPGRNLPDRLPRRTLISPLDNLSDWKAETQPDTAFEAPREWRGMPKAMGNFEITYQPGIAPPGTEAKGATTFTQRHLPGKHGLIPRYVSLVATPGNEIPIPAGTTQLGVWVYGNSTWAEVKLGLENAEGNKWLVLDDDSSCLMTDNFEGWRFLQTGQLSEDVYAGSCKLRRIVVTMPEQQVYVDDLLTTKKPQIAIWGLYSIQGKVPAVNYLPW